MLFETLPLANENSTSATKHKKNVAMIKHPVQPGVLLSYAQNDLGRGLYGLN
ncbi:MAG: hypothetical protein LBQ76_08595 [Candidatus Fibromonas sp.]|nr:hypothetical protein [Candidatus Fibromonas sp.]